MRFEKTEVWGFEHAIRGMRNPMNSWDKSDSYYQAKENKEGEINWEEQEYHIGQNDITLMKKLIKAGTEHRKFLRQIFVSVDITAPMYWWSEFDTYKVGTVANSTSKMHKLLAKPFEINDFANDRLITEESGKLKWGDTIAKNFMEHIVTVLNEYRNKYLETKDKDYWYSILQILPNSYNQKRTITMSYENVISIYNQRKHHKLDEWSNCFCSWCMSLPYFAILFNEDINK